MKAKATSVAPITPNLIHPRVDRELGGERARCQLRQSQTLLIFLEADPAPLVNQVALHGAGQGDRPTEAERAQPHEVGEQLPKAARAQRSLIRRVSAHNRPILDRQS